LEAEELGRGANNAATDRLATAQLSAIEAKAEEPPAPSSPLWIMARVLITPPTAGERRRYEDNVIEILRDNLERLWRGEQQSARPGGLPLVR
jgi:phosphoglycerate dehydrogenase-like enzyme